MREEWIEVVLTGFADLHEQLVECLKEEPALSQARFLLHKLRPGLAILEQVQRTDSTRLRTIANLSLRSDLLNRVSNAVWSEDSINAERAHRSFLLVKALTRDYTFCLERYSRYQGLRLTQLNNFLADFLQDDGWFGGSSSSATADLGGILCAIVDVIRGTTTSVEQYETLTTTILVGVLGAAARKSELVQANHKTIRGLRRFILEGSSGGQPAPSKKDRSTRETLVLEDEEDGSAANSLAPALQQAPEAALKEALAELESLVGLAGVKAEVKRLLSFLKIRQERRKHGLRETGQPIHFVFTGSSGTGKSTVARIVARIFFGFGLVKTPRLVKCGSLDLIGASRESIAARVEKVVASALDGILLIEQAGALFDASAHEMHGQEAIATLLRRMGELRDRLVVILAGPSGPMEQLLRSNPDLEGHFTRLIRFEDYPVSDLCLIFETFCAATEYTLTPLCRAHVGLVLLIAHNRRDERFANARLVHSLFEQAIDRHSQRLAELSGSSISKEVLAMLDGEDVPFNLVKDVVPAALDLREARWDGLCPTCSSVNRGSVKFLGQRVRCHCGQKFIFPWWSPVAKTLKGVPAGLLACDKALGRREEGGPTLPSSAQTMVGTTPAPSKTAKAAEAAEDDWKPDPQRAAALLEEGVWHLQNGECERAIECLETAISLDWAGSDPLERSYYLLRARAYEMRGDGGPLRSLEEYNEAANLYKQGYYPRCIRAYEKAVELDPACPWPLNNLAWLYASCSEGRYRSGSKSVRYAMAACALSHWHCWRFLNTLSASYAESGAFDKAVTMARKALLLAPREEQDKVREGIRLFHAHKPLQDRR